MDAYSHYILQQSNARLSELRREAAEYSLAAAARRRRGSWWSRLRLRLRLRPPRAPEPEVVGTLWGSHRRPETLEQA